MMDDIEAIARAFCAKMGLDPDEVVRDPVPEYVYQGKSTLETYEALRTWRHTHSPQWTQYRAKARLALEFHLMQEAVKESVAPKTPDTPSP